MLGKTIRGSDFDNIFTEVPHTEKLGLINPEQLRLFHLNVMNNRFVSDDLQSFIRKNVGRYVFSRAKLEQFRTNGDLESIGLEAMTIMTNNGRPGQKDTGNALGEILLYSFLEQILDAPKIMSKVELVTNANSHSSKCDGIHLLSLDGYAQPYYQLVFGSSSVVDDIKDAIDDKLPEKQSKRRCQRRRSKTRHGKNSDTGTRENSTPDGAEDNEDPAKPRFEQAEREDRQASPDE